MFKPIISYTLLMSGSELQLVNGDRFDILQANETVYKNNSFFDI